jgi:hypothetical protein
MIPETDEQLASVLRALTNVILPALPPQATLAREQTQLCIGHLQILRAQIDFIPAFEATELSDALVLGEELDKIVDGESALTFAIKEGRGARSPTEIRDARKAVYTAIATLVAASDELTQEQRTRLQTAILNAETKRAVKDRKWFAPYGFDTVP